MHYHPLSHCAVQSLCGAGGWGLGAGVVISLMAGQKRGLVLRIVVHAENQWTSSSVTIDSKHGVAGYTTDGVVLIEPE
jgi:hypothetical protein